MVYINIKNNDSSYVELEEDFEYNTIDCQYHILQPAEVGMGIAYQLLDVEYCITNEVLMDMVVDYLDDLIVKIKDSAESILDDNDIKVY